MDNALNAPSLTEAALAQLATDALRGLGLSQRDAADASRILVLADLFGVTTHGVSRIESYGERLEIGGIKPQPSIQLEKVAPTITRVDGDNGVGPLVGYRALEAAMEAARTHGVGIAFARAATLMAMSRMIGSPPGFGTPKPTGLLPRRVSFPPQGAIVVVALLPMMLAKPASAAMKL